MRQSNFIIGYLKRVSLLRVINNRENVTIVKKSLDAHSNENVEYIFTVKPCHYHRDDLSLTSGLERVSAMAPLFRIPTQCITENTDLYNRIRLIVFNIFVFMPHRGLKKKKPRYIRPKWAKISIDCIHIYNYATEKYSVFR